MASVPEDERGQAWRILQTVFTENLDSFSHLTPHEAAASLLQLYKIECNRKWPPPQETLPLRRGGHYPRPPPHLRREDVRRPPSLAAAASKPSPRTSSDRIKAAASAACPPAPHTGYTLPSQEYINALLDAASGINTAARRLPADPFPSPGKDPTRHPPGPV